MQMDYRPVTTSAEVVAVLRACHYDELRIFSSYTSMEDGIVRTEWGLPGSPIPLCGAETTWEPPEERMEETKASRYWLCQPKEPTS